MRYIIEWLVLSYRPTEIDNANIVELVGVQDSTKGCSPACTQVDFPRKTVVSFNYGYMWWWMMLIIMCARFLHKPNFKAFVKKRIDWGVFFFAKVTTMSNNMFFVLFLFFKKLFLTCFSSLCTKTIATSN